MADTSTMHEKIADAGRRSYEFVEGQEVPVRKTKFKTIKTQPGAMDDPGVERGRQSQARKNKMLEELD